MDPNYRFHREGFLKKKKFFFDKKLRPEESRAQDKVEKKTLSKKNKKK